MFENFPKLNSKTFITLCSWFGGSHLNAWSSKPADVLSGELCENYKDFIRKISNNHKYVYFLLISNNDSLKDHFITKSIELKFFEKKESEELIKKCIISEFKDMTEDDLESVLNDLFEFRNAEFKTETDPKDLKKIIDIINNENNDEWSDKADDIKKLKGINIIKDEMY